MKRLSHLGFVGLLATLLAGCPVFSDGGGGDNWGSCSGASCPGAASSSGAGGGSVAPGCATSADCGVNETCGADAQCHTGDCTIWGCSAGNTCIVDPASHLASCEPSGQGGASSSSSGAGGAGGGSTTSSSSGAGGSTTSSSSSGGGAGGGSTTSSSSGGGGGGGAPTVWCGNPSDCATGQTCAPDGTCHAGDCAANGCITGYTCGANGACARSNPAGCAKDADCAAAGSGYACVSGVCTAPANQCWDGAQCVGTTGNDGNACVSGKCIDACTTSANCAPSATCNTALGVCSDPATACTITNDCGGATQVCVDGACVPRSTNGTCASGYVWVDNGCIPDQKASFTCDTDGQMGSSGGSPGKTCAADSICVHHSCYFACAQGDNAACKQKDATLPLCKAVSEAATTYYVCGAANNLGADCDPTSVPPKACSAGKVCIDGYCK